MLARMVAPPEWLEAHLGPVEAIALTLSSSSPGGWDALLAAVDAHQLRVLDVEFVRLTASGIELLSAADASEFAPAEFAGASSGLLDAAAASLSAGRGAILMVPDAAALAAASAAAPAARPLRAFSAGDGCRLTLR